MILLIFGAVSGGLILVLCLSSLVIGSGFSYIMWQQALKTKSKKIISEAETEAEVIKKEKILQAKERFLQLKTEHEKVINEKNNKIAQSESRIRQKELSLSQKLEESQRKRNETEAIRENLTSQLELVEKNPKNCPDSTVNRLINLNLFRACQLKKPEISLLNHSGRRLKPVPCLI